MTYNIRYDNPNDGENSWNLRKSSVVDLIDKYRPDILGIQEGLSNQVHYLDSCLVNFTYIGVGREDGKQKGEFSAIFYDSTIFRVLTSSTFWLSKTINTVSVGWDAALERICTYGLFEHKSSGKKIWIFNTHFDHIGKRARKNSAKLIINKIKDLNTENYPVILTGDLNTKPGSKPIIILDDYLTRVSVASKKPLNGPTGTFTGFEKEYPLNESIDYIFESNLKVQSCIHIADRRPNQLFISDHLPVMATFDF